MTNKELRRLRRVELLNLLLEQSRESERLREELEKTKAELNDRQIIIEKAGTLAEAALTLNGVFEAADRAVQQYVSNAETMEENMRRQYEEKIAGAREVCANMKTEMENYCTGVRAETEKYCSNLKAETEETCAQQKSETEEACAGMRTEAEKYCSNLKAETEEACAQQKNETEEACQERIAETSRQAEARWSEISGKLQAFYETHQGLEDLISQDSILHSGVHAGVSDE